MTEIATNTTITTPISPATFEALVALITLLADPKASGSRLSELEKRQAAAAAAEAELTEARAQHDATIARERQELEAKSSKLDDREIALMRREGALEHRYQLIVEKERRDAITSGRIQNIGNGMTREFFSAADAAAEQAENDHLVPDQDFKAIPGSGLTRDVAIRRGPGRPRKEV